MSYCSAWKFFLFEINNLESALETWIALPTQLVAHPHCDATAPSGPGRNDQLQFQFSMQVALRQLPLAGGSRYAARRSPTTIADACHRRRRIYKAMEALDYLTHGRAKAKLVLRMREAYFRRGGVSRPSPQLTIATRSGPS